MSVALPTRIARRLAASLSLVVSPAAYPCAAAWRQAVARDLSALVGADASLIAVEGDAQATFQAIDLDAAILRAYEEHFASVDVGIARQRARAIDVWCRHSLWGAAELRRSEYYNDFARPNRLHDSLGIFAATPGASARVRISLLRSRVLGSRHGVPRLGLLELLLPAFRAGVALSCSSIAPDSTTNIIDGVDHPLVLCDEAGQEVYHNGALERAADAFGERLAATIGEVTRAVAAARRKAPAGQAVSVRMNTPSGEWSVLGSALPCYDDWSVGGKAVSRVLISLSKQERTRCSTHDTLRARYHLTAREAQVVELLRQRRSNIEIASALHISAHTARHHTENVLQKLGLHSRNAVDARLAGDQNGN